MVLLPGLSDGVQGGPKESTDAFILFCCIAGALVVLAGLMSGLTLGLLSLDHVAVEVRNLGLQLMRRRMSCMFTCNLEVHFHVDLNAEEMPYFQL